jgi:hypothetical protein
MSDNVAKAELNSVTKDENNPYRHLFTHAEIDQIDSATAEEYNPVFWTGHTTVKIDPHKSGEESDSSSDKNRVTSVTYTNTVYHDFTISSSIGLIIPDLELKDEYKDDYVFKLEEYIGYSIVSEAVFSSSSRRVDCLDPNGQIFLFNKVVKPGISKKLMMGMGIKTVCAEWTTSISRCVLFYPQMYGYSFWECKMWPVYKQANLSDVAYSYNYTLSIEKHLQMQKLNRNTLMYEYIEVNMAYFKDPKAEFEIPKLYNRMCDMSDTELVKRKHIDLNTFYLHTLINCDLPNEITLGTSELKLEVPIKSCKGVTQAILWALENISGDKYNITHNYTFDLVETPASKTGILSNSVVTEAGEKFVNIPSEVFESQLASFFRTAGTKSGILGVPYGVIFCRGNIGGSCPDIIGTVLKAKVRATKQKKVRCKFIVRVLTCESFTFNSEGKLEPARVNL